MRISCDSVICNRGLATHNIKANGKSVRSSLAIGKKPSAASKEKEQDIFLMVSTNLDRAGKKYLIKGNVIKIFGNFIGDGKATLRLRDPPHDLCLSKADPIQLKAFLNVVKKVLEGKETVKDLSLSAIAPASVQQVTKPKTRLVVASKKDYPITTGFPPSLEQLYLVQLNLRRLDSRIWKLNHLRILDMSENVLTELPADLGGMKRLQQLTLAGNRIQSLPHGLCSNSRLSETLTSLDLSENGIKILPNWICNLKSIVTLVLKKNELARLPFSLGKMAALKFLNVAENQLETLPGGLAQLRLEEVDLCGNPIRDTAADSGRVLFNTLQFPSLLELCLTFCMRHKRKDLVVGNVPNSILSAVDSHERCRCGKLCFNSKAVILNPLPLSRLATSVSSDHSSALFETVVCSRKCWDRYGKNPFAA